MERVDYQDCIDNHRKRQTLVQALPFRDDVLDACVLYRSVWRRCRTTTFDGFIVKAGGSNGAFEGQSGGCIFAQQYDADAPIARIGRIFRQQWLGIGATLDIGHSFLSQAGGAAPVFGQHAPQTNQPPFPVSLGSGLSLAVVDFRNDIAGFIKATNDDNVARILAEPKLLARSGEKASFLSGGEIPILISEDQQTSVSYKEFGVKVEFVPTVTIDGTIDLDVFAEVSEPDFSQGVELFGFTVPAFVSRRAQTSVSLSSGRSLVIAGLLKTSERDFTSKVPILGSVPILGAFFRRSEKEKFETELIMVVKPVLLGPDGQDASAAASQGDGAVDFIRKKTEGAKPR
jgi:Flp pilus assembly secretin CpaC